MIYKFPAVNIRKSPKETWMRVIFSKKALEVMNFPKELCLYMFPDGIRLKYPQIDDNKTYRISNNGNMCLTAEDESVLGLYELHRLTPDTFTLKKTKL